MLIDSAMDLLSNSLLNIIAVNLYNIVVMTGLYCVLLESHNECTEREGGLRTIATNERQARELHMVRKREMDQWMLAATLVQLPKSRL